jgi:two-component system, OmpR family, response regulator RegX3
VLLVEDDPSVANATADLLQMHGYRVSLVVTGSDALANAGDVDLVLLDLGLPDLDGIEVCRRIRATSDVPIMAISARSGEVDKVLALRTGADDYIVKPYGVHELLARVEAVLRRSQTSRPTGDAQVHTTTRVRVDARLEIDVAAHRCWTDGVESALTRKEFAVLAILAAQPGTVARRERILKDVWGDEWMSAPRTLDVHISSLRTKLGDAVNIEVVRGVGYRLGRITSGN